MKITEKDVARVADLAHLELSEAERARMVLDLTSILDYVEKLNELDTSNVPPMAQLTGGSNQLEEGSLQKQTSRPDVLNGLRKSLPHDIALENAPESDGVFFKVPKVIER